MSTAVELAVKAELASLLALRSDFVKYNQVDSYFRDEGPLRRELYPKHIEFFELGSRYDIRAFLAANQVGKTTAACYELRCHLTGRYPHWWSGRRFKRAIKAWAVSDSGQTTRDGVQDRLIGQKHDIGTGLIERECIGDIHWNDDYCDRVFIKHVSGEWSELGFKSYEQGRNKFQAVKRDVILLDEEPKDRNIFTECITRTAATNGIVLLSFTSLLGITPLVLGFLPELGGSDVDVEAMELKNQAVVMCGWDDVPHLDEKRKALLKSQYLPHELSARTTGMPSVAIGSVYPTPETEIVTEYFPPPPFWPRVCAMDPGGSSNGNGKTAGLWAAIDRSSDCVYFYGQYYAGWKEPSVHTAAFKGRGSWIPCVSDDSMSVETGRSIIAVYRKEGLRITPAIKADRSARIYELYNRFSTGRAKIMKGVCPDLLMELRLHRVDEKNKYQGPCHLINCAEYIVQSGLQKAALMPVDTSSPKLQEQTFGIY